MIVIRSETDILKARIRALKKDVKHWKEMAQGLQRFVATVARSSNQNPYARTVFVDSRRLWTGAHAAAAQTRASQRGRLQRLTELPAVVPAPPS